MTLSPEALALDFCQELLTCMTAAQVHEAARMNTSEPSLQDCHTHGFCDANMTMQAAFLQHGMDPANKGGMELWGGHWNLAWRLAKSNGANLV